MPSDTTAPSPASAEVPSDGGQVDVVFDEDLVRPTMAVAGAFTLTADGVELDVENLSGGADTLIFNLAFGTKIYAGQIVRLSYDKTLAGADALEDAAGNEVASFTDFPVTNNSGADNTEPEETHPNGTPRLVIDDKGTLSTTGEGRLEVFFKGDWGTVCDDRFDRPFFDYSIETEGAPGESNAPKVANIAGARACQLLGHDTGEMVSRSSLGMTPHPNVKRGEENFRPIWLDDVRCSEATHGTVSGLQHCYHAGVGLHNCGTPNKPDHKEDVHLRCIPEGTTTRVALTAKFVDVPAEHSGEEFSFRIAFSEPVVDLIGQDLVNGPLMLTGAQPVRLALVDGRYDLLEVFVNPTEGRDVSIALESGHECYRRATETDPHPSGKKWTVCTRELYTQDGTAADVGDPLPLSETVTITVPAGTNTAMTARSIDAGPAPLTAWFKGVPAEHDGENEFPVELWFSEPPAGPGWYGARNIAVENAIDITGGAVVSVRSIEQNGAHRRIVVQPSGTGAVTLSLPPGGPACDQAGALCTDAGGRLEVGALIQIRGPAALSVADAEVREGPGAALAFSVTLDRSTSAAVQVDYATRDGAAQAGSDYTANSGALNFAPGETAKTVTVAVLDDSHDEGSETLTLVLSNPSGAYLADAEATGTIENSDPLPQAWLSRFGRSAAVQVVTLLDERFEAAAAGEATLLERALWTLLIQRGRVQFDARQFISQSSFDVSWTGRGGSGRASRHGDDCTECEVTLAPVFDGRWSLWGRGALMQFSGEDRDVNVSGDVLTGLLGVDYARDRWLAGAALAYHDGDGSYSAAGGRGDLDSVLVTVNPYLRYALTPRLSVWGTLGYGAGTLSLRQAGAAAPDSGAGRQGEAAVIETDLRMGMGALGLRGVVYAGAHTELALKSDAMWVHTSSAQTAGMRGAGADTSRIRLLLSGQHQRALANDALLSPGFELGLRYDDGDAETGFGLELGGGLRYADLLRGLSIEAKARALLAHDDGGYEEWGLSGSLSLDPGRLGRGLALRLDSGWGMADSGAEALWRRQTTAGIAPQHDSAPQQRVTAEMGYGLELGGGLRYADPAARLKHRGEGAGVAGPR